MVIVAQEPLLVESGAAAGLGVLVATTWLAGMFVTGALATWLGALASGLRRLTHEQGHWTERARWRWSVACSAIITVLMVPIAAGATGVVIAERVLGVPERPFAVLSGLVALAGVALAGGRIVRSTRSPAPTWSQLLRGWTATALLFWPAVLVAIVAALVMPREFGVWTLLVLLAASAAVVALAAGGVGTVLLLIGIARPADAALRERIERVMSASGGRPKNIVVLQSLYANALVFPIPRLLIVLRPLLEILDDEQLAAILAHEAGHLGEPRKVGWLRVMPSLVLVSLSVSAPLYAVGGVLANLLHALAALVVALGFRKWARGLELRADEVAHAHDEEHAHDGSFAAALLRLSEHNLTPAVHGKGGTHPHLYDRMLEAGVEPAFERPAPPSRNRLRAGMLVATVAGGAGIIATAAVAAILALALRH